MHASSSKSHSSWPADFRCLLAGEEVAPQLLQPLADPLELGDADACNDPQKMHSKDPPKDTQAPWSSILNWMAGWEDGWMLDVPWMCIYMDSTHVQGHLLIENFKFS